MVIVLVEFVMDRVIVDKKLIVKLRRLDRFNSESKHLKSTYNSRLAIEQLKAEKRIERLL